MESPASRRILIVANRTAATPALLEAVRRAPRRPHAASPCWSRGRSGMPTPRSRRSRSSPLSRCSRRRPGVAWKASSATRTRSWRSPGRSSTAIRRDHHLDAARHASRTGCTSTSPRVCSASVCRSRSSPRERPTGPHARRLTGPRRIAALGVLDRWCRVSARCAGDLRSRVAGRAGRPRRGAGPRGRWRAGRGRCGRPPRPSPARRARRGSGPPLGRTARR